MIAPGKGGTSRKLEETGNQAGFRSKSSRNCKAVPLQRQAYKAGLYFQLQLGMKFCPS